MALPNGPLPLALHVTMTMYDFQGYKPSVTLLMTLCDQSHINDLVQ